MVAEPDDMVRREVGGEVVRELHEEEQKEAVDTQPRRSEVEGKALEHPFVFITLRTVKTNRESLRVTKIPLLAYGF